MHSYFTGPSKLDSSIMDLNTVEVLGLWNLPHIGGEKPLFVLSTRFCTKGRPFSDEYNDSGNPGVIVHTLLSCFLVHVYFTTASAPYFLWSDFHLFRPRASKTKLANRVLA